MNEATLFHRALEINDPAERAKFLQTACQGDELLKSRIEQLLLAHEQPDSFFEGPAHRAMEFSQMNNATVDHGTGDPEQLGQRIGPYKLLQKIGEGGMGVVYMAEQTEPVQRRVALKIVKLGMDSRQVTARFEAERQALAMMDHPNIAKVLDAGTTPTGRPFFVMELVHGLPITEYCDQQKLSPRQRLELFISVCRAVQHAHQKGVIHRDLKPSNILVTEYDHRAVPKVIDFGVAKATGQQLTEKTLFTEFGQIIGTLEYMSPEQAKRNQLDVDTRSDIYSLGIVLYALLTGETPFGSQRFEDAAWDEVLRVIREEEPIRPSARLSGSQSIDEVAGQRNTEPRRLASLVRGDLDWIVMKALAKDRSKRYGSANELADDIIRHLEQQPIVARPPSTIDRIHKLFRRNRRTVAAGVVIMAIVLLAAIWRARDVAEQRRQVAHRSQRLSVALEQAARALGTAVSSPVGRDTEWLLALTHAVRVQDLLDDGAVHQDVADRANEFLLGFGEAREDRDLAEQIEAVVIAGATNPDLESWTNMERQMRDLFRKHGFDLDQDDPAEIAQRIRDHRAASHWADLLELWIGTRGQMAALGGPASECGHHAAVGRCDVPGRPRSRSYGRAKVYL